MFAFSPIIYRVPIRAPNRTIVTNVLGQQMALWLVCRLSETDDVRFQLTLRVVHFSHPHARKRAEKFASVH